MRRRLSSLTLAFILAVLSAGIGSYPGLADESTPETATEARDASVSRAEQESVRVRPSPRPYDNPHAQPDATNTSVRGSRELETLEEAEPPRLDDPVLRWLPEITAASKATGTPLSLIAGVMRLESSGDPTIISPQGARGLMQVMPDELRTQNIPADNWLDPPTNIMAGAVILAQRSGNGWESAAAYYFGIGCDDYGTCTYGYVVAIIGWANAYATLLGDGMYYDVNRIPDVPDSPDPTATPSPTPIDSAEPTVTSSATPNGKTAVPTDVATSEPTAELSEVPTEIPTEEPTAVPTDVPIEIPTEEPTEEIVPTEEALSDGE